MKKLIAPLLGVLASVAIASPDVQVKELKAQPTVVIAATVKSEEEVAPKLYEVIPKVYFYIEKKGLEIAGAPFSRYFVHESGKIVFEAGFPVTKKAPGEGDIIASELPAGSTALLLHVGPFEKVSQAYETIHAWMKKNNKEPNGAPWEMYLSDPSEVKPEDMQTEVYYPIK